MFNQKGQAFDVFKLLIAAIVAVVILALLLEIIKQIVPPGANPVDKTNDLVKGLSNGNLAQYKLTEKVTFVRGIILSNLAIANASGGSLQKEDVCVVPGDFDGVTGWGGTSNISVQYSSPNNLQAIVGAICDNGSRMADPDYFESYTGGAIASNWVGSCGCVRADNTQTCCIVAVKRS